MRVRAYLSLLSVLALSSVMVVTPFAGSASAANRFGSRRAVDVTGKWVLTVTTDGGSGKPTVTFKQHGDSLTGHYSSDMLGETDIKGTVKEQKINFSFRTEALGTALVVTYDGIVEGNDSMKGTVDLGGMAKGTFTAKRQ